MSRLENVIGNLAYETEENITDCCNKLPCIFRIAEMEETHQDVLLKLREDMMREEEKHISRAVADVRSVEEEKQEALMKDLQQKEQERIKAAVDTERKIMESQYGSVTQVQLVSLDMKLVLRRLERVLSCTRE